MARQSWHDAGTLRCTWLKGDRRSTGTPCQRRYRYSRDTQIDPFTALLTPMNMHAQPVIVTMLTWCHLLQGKYSGKRTSLVFPNYPVLAIGRLTVSSEQIVATCGCAWITTCSMQHRRSCYGVEDGKRRTCAWCSLTKHKASEK